MSTTYSSSFSHQAISQCHGLVNVIEFSRFGYNRFGRSDPHELPHVLGSGFRRYLHSIRRYPHFRRRFYGPFSLARIAAFLCLQNPSFPPSCFLNFRHTNNRNLYRFLSIGTVCANSSATDTPNPGEQSPPFLQAPLLLAQRESVHFLLSLTNAVSPKDRNSTLFLTFNGSQPSYELRLHITFDPTYTYDLISSLSSTRSDHVLL
jgi:hypothetical protein